MRIYIYVHLHMYVYVYYIYIYMYTYTCDAHRGTACHCSWSSTQKAPICWIIGPWNPQWSRIFRVAAGSLNVAFAGFAIKCIRV